MAYLNNIKFKGVAGGAVTYIILYVLYTYTINLAFRKNIDFNILQPYLTFGGYIVWFITGYMAGYFSRSSGVLNGAIVGSITPIIMILYLIINLDGFPQIKDSIINDGLFWLYAGFVLCGIGGLIWDIQQKILKSRL